MRGHVFVNAGLGDVGGCRHRRRATLVLGNMGDIIDGGAGGRGDVVVGRHWYWGIWGTSLTVRLGDVGGHRCHCRCQATLVPGDMGDIVDGEAGGRGDVVVGRHWCGGTWGTLLTVRLGDVGGCHCCCRATLVPGHMGDGIDGGAIGGRVVVVMVVMCVCWGACWWLTQWWKW